MTMTTTALVPRIENLPALVGSLDSYIQTVNRMPMLSTEEEQELAQRLRLQNDLEAAQRLIVAHLRFEPITPIYAAGDCSSAGSPAASTALPRVVKTK